MGSHKLAEIVFYVSLIVVIALAITFTILFVLYSIYKRKNIKNSHEDETILNELKKKSHIEDKQISSNENIQTSDNNEKLSLVSYVKKYEKKSRFFGFIGNTISYILFICVCVLGVFILSFKVGGDTFFFGNTTYLVIKTGSMEKAYSGNTYLKDNNLNNQITQYSLIGIDKVEAKDVKLYDILAFTNTDGDTIVHRVINITNENNEYRFTFRGDANTASNVYETSVKEANIIGRYNGFQNYGLGVATTYFKSSAGILALISATVFLVAFEISEDLIDKEYKTRKLIVAEQYDNSRE